MDFFMEDDPPSYGRRDGSGGRFPLASTNRAETLSNKTLVAPTITGAAVISGAISLGAGSAAVPAITFGDADSGFFVETGSSGTRVAFGSDGLASIVFAGGGPVLPVNNRLGFSASGLTSGGDTYLSRTAANTLRLEDLLSTTYGTFEGAGYRLGTGSGGATTSTKVIKKVTTIADNSATAVLTVTVPNANHAAGIRLLLLSSNGGSDAFESTRVATGFVVLSRTTGANVVAAVAALDSAQIATVAAGATHTLAYGVSAITGAVDAVNTFDITVTIDDSGNVGGNQVVIVAELINSEATGVTMA